MANQKLLSLLFLSALGLGSAAAQKTASGAYSAAGKTAHVFATVQGTSQRLAAGDDLKFVPAAQPVETQVCVFVDPGHSFQTMLGIGGALTDAAAETFAKLPKPQQQAFLKAYYSPTAGIGYTLGRTSIHSSDFSSGSYTYVADQDEAMKTFSVRHDEQFRIPFIKQVLAAAGGRLTLYVSPWSPPGWMKTNGEMLHGGQLLPQYRQAWANYYVKFIQTYEQLGILIWGLTVQNEPMATQQWESCVFTGEQERDFIKGYLGPTLTKNGLGGKKLIAWDHNRDLLFQRASTVLNDPEAAKYVWGIGYHWYETWTGSSMLFENEKRVQEAFPNTNLIFTEGCQEKFDFAKLDDWALGEKYGHSMINDFNAGTVGWTDWNVLLDETGGPNHAGNFCFAPVIANTKTGQLIYTNAYYYIGHFAKFIRPGAKRISASANRAALQTTAYRNPDGSLAVVVMNQTDQPQEFQLWLRGQGTKTTAAPHSIMTLVVN